MRRKPLPILSLHLDLCVLCVSAVNLAFASPSVLSTIFHVYFRLTRQTLLQPFANHLNILTPLKSLTPTLTNSYKMFFQKVILLLPTCCTLLIESPALLPLPCYYGQSAVEPAKVADVGLGVRGIFRNLTYLLAISAADILTTDCRESSRAIRRNDTKMPL